MEIMFLYVIVIKKIIILYSSVVEQWSFKPKVVGSIPTATILWLDNIMVMCGSAKSEMMVQLHL